MGKVDRIGRMRTDDESLDGGRHIFTFSDNVVLLADSNQLLRSLFSDMFRGGPSNGNRS